MAGQMVAVKVVMMAVNWVDMRVVHSAAQTVE
jgi:hypothetical protein